MIKGKLKVQLTIDSVLERINPLDIYSHYMPHKNWEINKPCISPFPRNGKIENNPSFIIGNKYGNITHIDWGLGYKGDCFSFVNQLYGNNLSLDCILKIIDKDMKLGILEGSEVRKSPIIHIEKQEITKKNTLIQIITRKFTKQELDYWAQYYQDIEDLKREHIYSIKKAYLNKKQLSLDELRFGYLYDNKWWKIYQPLANKKKKWLTNVPLTYMDGLENIKNCDVAWLTKSKKDKMTLLKLYSCVASTQNESIACFSPENVKYIKENSKKQVVLYDSDETGVRSCQEITKKFDFGYCNVPRKYLEEGIKDFSDLAKVHGLKAVEEVLKSKNLI